MMNRIIEILMKRDGNTEKEAESRLDEVKTCWKNVIMMLMKLKTLYWNSWIGNGLS